MLADATDLSPQQCTAPSDHNRALAPKDFLFGAIHPHPRETGILQGTKLFQRNVQKILVLRGNQRTNEMVGGSVEILKVVRRIEQDRKSTRLNSSHRCISYAVFCLKKKKK